MVKNLAEEILEMMEEFVFDLIDVGYGCLAYNQGGVVVVCASVLDEEQAGRDSSRPLPLGNDGVKECLEVVVTVVADVGRVEDSGYVGERLQAAATCLVVDDTDTFRAIG